MLPVRFIRLDSPLFQNSVHFDGAGTPYSVCPFRIPDCAGFIRSFPGEAQARRHKAERAVVPEPWMTDLLAALFSDACEQWRGHYRMEKIYIYTVRSDPYIIQMFGSD